MRPFGRTSSVVCRSVWLAWITEWTRRPPRRRVRGPVSSRCEPRISSIGRRAGRLLPRGSRGGRTRARGRRRCATRAATVSPSSATASIRVCRNSRRASGSSAATGSSSTSSSGRLASASVSATCACWPPDSLPTFCRVGCRAREPLAREVVVPAGLSLRPSLSISATEAPVERMVLRDEPDAGQHEPRLLARRPDRRRAPRRRSARRARPAVQQRRLAGAVGADQRGDRAAGILSEQSRSAQCEP